MAAKNPLHLDKQISVLVDCLRKTEGSDMSLVNGASVTEVLVSSRSRFLTSVDTSIYAEFRELSDYISRAKKEILAVQPTEIKEIDIPRAGLELSAIVHQTEAATHAIMGATEAMMAASTDSVEECKKAQDTAATQIFEACSFQDITGQRIAKVIDTLNHIESRLTDLSALMDTEGSGDPSKPGGTVTPFKSGNNEFLSGPSLEGDGGVTQSEVDALLA